LSFAARTALRLLAGLDVEGICASSGSACSAGSLEPSHVIVAIGGKNLANSLVRFSLGRDSTAEEVDFVCALCRKLSAAHNSANNRTHFVNEPANNANNFHFQIFLVSLTLTCRDDS
jgi:cysteine sulfinate desulfinase/cysteine desulfurase-like protein